MAASAIAGRKVPAVKRLVCLAALTAIAALAHGAELPLPALVPDDVGMCIEVRNLAEAVREFRSSAQFQRLNEFPPWRRWHEKESRQLAEITGQVATLMGLQWSDLWGNVLGHQSLVAIWPPKPGSEGEANQPPAVILIRAKDAGTLRKVADAFRAAQSLFESVSWRRATYQGIDYQLGSRSSESKRPALRLAVIDSLAVLSEHEAAFHGVLELARRQDAREVSGPSAQRRGSLAELPSYKTAAAQMPTGAVLTCFVHPRSWQALMRADVESAAPAQRAEKQLVLDTWSALESFWASLELSPRLAVRAVVRYDGKALPAPVAEFVACFAGPSQFPAKTPGDALVAAAMRVDVDRLITWARKYGDANKRQEAEAEVVAELLRLLGPDVGAYVRVDRGADSQNWLQWAAAVAVRPQMPRDLEVQQMVRAAIPSLLAGVAKLFTESASSRLAGLLTGEGLKLVDDSLRISRSAIPTISLSDGQLWAAGIERALDEARALGPQRSLAASARWTNHLTELTRDPSHLLYVDCAAWHQILTQQTDDLVARAVRQRGVDEAVARRGLKQLVALLRLTDTLVGVIKIDDGQIAASLSVSVDPSSSGSSTSASSPASSSASAGQPARP